MGTQRPSLYALHLQNHQQRRKLLSSSPSKRTEQLRSANAKPQRTSPTTTSPSRRVLKTQMLAQKQQKPRARRLSKKVLPAVAPKNINHRFPVASPLKGRRNTPLMPQLKPKPERTTTHAETLLASPHFLPNVVLQTASPNGSTHIEQGPTKSSTVTSSKEGPQDLSQDVHITPVTSATISSATDSNASQPNFLHQKSRRRSNISYSSLSQLTPEYNVTKKATKELVPPGTENDSARRWGSLSPRNTFKTEKPLLKTGTQTRQERRASRHLGEELAQQFKSSRVAEKGVVSNKKPKQAQLDLTQPLTVEVLVDALYGKLRKTVSKKRCVFASSSATHEAALKVKQYCKILLDTITKSVTKKQKTFSFQECCHCCRTMLRDPAIQNHAKLNQETTKASSPTVRYASQSVPQPKQPGLLCWLPDEKQNLQLVVLPNFPKLKQRNFTPAPRKKASALFNWVAQCCKSPEVDAASQRAEHSTRFQKFLTNREEKTSYRSDDVLATKEAYETLIYSLPPWYNASRTPGFPSFLSPSPSSHDVPVSIAPENRTASFHALKSFPSSTGSDSLTRNGFLSHQSMQLGKTLSTVSFSKDLQQKSIEKLSTNISRDGEVTSQTLDVYDKESAEQKTGTPIFAVDAPSQKRSIRDAQDALKLKNAMQLEDVLKKSLEKRSSTSKVPSSKLISQRAALTNTLRNIQKYTRKAVPKQLPTPPGIVSRSLLRRHIQRKNALTALLLKKRTALVRKDASPQKDVMPQKKILAGKVSVEDKRIEQPNLPATSDKAKILGSSKKVLRTGGSMAGHESELLKMRTKNQQKPELYRQSTLQRLKTEKHSIALANYDEKNFPVEAVFGDDTERKPLVTTSTVPENSQQKLPRNDPLVKTKKPLPKPIQIAKGDRTLHGLTTPNLPVDSMKKDPYTVDSLEFAPGEAKTGLHEKKRTLVKPVHPIGDMKSPSARNFIAIFQERDEQVSAIKPRRTETKLDHPKISTAVTNKQSSIVRQQSTPERVEKIKTQISSIPIKEKKKPKAEVAALLERRRERGIMESVSLDMGLRQNPQLSLLSDKDRSILDEEANTTASFFDYVRATTLPSVMSKIQHRSVEVLLTKKNAQGSIPKQRSNDDLLEAKFDWDKEREKTKEQKRFISKQQEKLSKDSRHNELTVCRVDQKQHLKQPDSTVFTKNVPMRPAIKPVEALLDQEPHSSENKTKYAVQLKQANMVFKSQKKPLIAASNYPRDQTALEKTYGKIASKYAVEPFSTLDQDAIPTLETPQVTDALKPRDGPRLPASAVKDSAVSIGSLSKIKQPLPSHPPEATEADIGSQTKFFTAKAVTPLEDFSLEYSAKVKSSSVKVQEQCQKAVEANVPGKMLSHNTSGVRGVTLNGTVAPKDIEASFISGASKEPTGDREQMLQSLKTFPSPKNVKRFPKHLWRSHSSNFFTSNKTDFKAMPETWSSGVTFENALDKLWKEVDRFNSLTPETSDVASDIVAKIDTHLASKNYIGAMPTKLPERIQKQDTKKSFPKSDPALVPRVPAQLKSDTKDWDTKVPHPLPRNDAKSSLDLKPITSAPLSSENVKVPLQTAIPAKQFNVGAVVVKKPATPLMLKKEFISKPDVPKKALLPVEIKKSLANKSPAVETKASEVPTNQDDVRSLLKDDDQTLTQAVKTAKINIPSKVFVPPVLESQSGNDLHKAIKVDFLKKVTETASSVKKPPFMMKKLPKPAENKCILKDVQAPLVTSAKDETTDGVKTTFKNDVPCKDHLTSTTSPLEQSLPVSAPEAPSQLQDEEAGATAAEMSWDSVAFVPAEPKVQVRVALNKESVAGVDEARSEVERVVPKTWPIKKPPIIIGKKTSDLPVLGAAKSSASVRSVLDQHSTAEDSTNEPQRIEARDVLPKKNVLKIPKTNLDGQDKNLKIKADSYGSTFAQGKNGYKKEALSSNQQSEEIAKVLPFKKPFGKMVIAPKLKQNVETQELKTSSTAKTSLPKTWSLGSETHVASESNKTEITSLSSQSSNAMSDINKNTHILLTKQDTSKEQAKQQPFEQGKAADQIVTEQKFDSVNMSEGIEVPKKSALPRPKAPKMVEKNAGRRPTTPITAVGLVLQSQKSEHEQKSNGSEPRCAEKGAQLDEDSSHSSEKHSRTTVSSEDVALAREATNDINRDPSSVKPIDSPLSFVALLTKADGKLTHLDSSVKDQETEGSLRSIEDIENTADQKNFGAGSLAPKIKTIHPKKLPCSPKIKSVLTPGAKDFDGSSIQPRTELTEQHPKAKRQSVFQSTVASNLEQGTAERSKEDKNIGATNYETQDVPRLEDPAESSCEAPLSATAADLGENLEDIAKKNEPEEANVSTRPTFTRSAETDILAKKTDQAVEHVAKSKSLDAVGGKAVMPDSKSSKRKSLSWFPFRSRFR